VNRDELAGWLAAYERAWRAPGTQAVADLFVSDATYQMAPYAQPYVGVEQISDLWERERDSPDEVFTMDCEIVALDGDTGVIRVTVRYGDPVEEEYRDLWIIRLDETGRCASFEEWPFRADYRKPAV
jgi:hypothetical protein